MGGSGAAASGGGQQETGPPLAVLGGEVVTPLPPGPSGSHEDESPSVTGIAEEPGSRPT
jgi:hypothetical protein